MACPSLIAVTNSSPGENPASPKLEYKPRIAFPTRAAPQSVTVRRNQLGFDCGGEAGAVVGGEAEESTTTDASLDDAVALKAVLLEAPAAAAAGSVYRSLTGIIWGITTRLVCEAPGSMASCVDTMPLSLATAFAAALAPPTRRKSNSTKTADGCVSRTNFPAKTADCSEMCAVPNK